MESQVENFFWGKMACQFFVHWEKKEVVVSARFFYSFHNFFTDSLFEKFLFDSPDASPNINAKMCKIPRKIAEYASQLI